MSHISKRSSIITGVLIAASTIGIAVASPTLAVVHAGSNDASSQPDANAAVADEYIIQLEPTTVDTNDGSIAAQSAETDPLRQRIDRVLGALAADAASEGGVQAQSAEGADSAVSVSAEMPSIDGFAAQLTPEQVELVKGMDGVKGVFPNSMLDAGSQNSEGGVSADAATTSWGLDRIDQPDLPLNGAYSPPATGAGTHVYVVGSGIWADHEQFTGRIGDGVNLVPDQDPADQPATCFAPSTRDASIVAGATLGVASSATLHSVRVTDCSGLATGIRAVQAVDWIAANAPARSVVLIALSGWFYAPLNDAIEYLERRGVTTVVPSDTKIARPEETVQTSSLPDGRPGDACTSSPASAPSALTVAASGADDRTAAFSATGRCIDMFAPGVDVPTADVASPTAVATDSGSRTAAAFVAGAVALYLEQHPAATPAQARRAVIDAAVADRLTTTDVLAPNRLLNVAAMGAPNPAPVDAKPIAHIVQPAAAAVGDAVVFDGSMSRDAAGGTNLTYQWRRSDADGVLSSVPTMTATYEKEGAYTATLTVTDRNGASATTFVWVTVGPESETPTEGETVPNQYVVSLAEPAGLSGGDLDDRVAAVMAKVDASANATTTPRPVENAVLAELKSVNGFSATLDTEAVDVLKSLPEVRAVYPNKVYRAQRAAVTGAHTNAARPTTSWGLDRIDQRDLPGNGNYDAPNDGSGTHIYVADQGIWPGHSEFAGRLGDGYDAIGGATDPSCFDHGTHVAGIAGGETVGVAPGAMLHSVRVLNCGGSGSIAQILSGIDWIVDHLQQPAVVNFSLGGPRDEALNTAIGYLTAQGATVVAAAGNDGADACPYSPGGSPQAITVAASESTDDAAGRTRFGRCVDLYAPGVGITSAAVTGPSNFVDNSGTSMASPFVAGAAALYLKQHPTATPAQVRDALRRGASVDRVHGVVGDTPNLLLNVSSMPAPDPTVASSAPVAHIATTGTPLAKVAYLFDGRSSTVIGGGSVTYEWRVSDSGKVAGTESTLSYAFDGPGNYRVGLRVTNAAGESSWTTTNVTVLEPEAPVVKSTITMASTYRVLEPTPGDDGVLRYRGIGDQKLNFSAKDSTDPNGGELSFLWTVEYEGKKIQVDWFEFSRTFFLVNGQPGTVEVTLDVTNEQGIVTTQKMEISLEARQDPVAVISPTDEVLNVFQGESITLDGSGSISPNGGPLKYAWKASTGFGTIGNDPTLTYKFDDVGRFSFTLSVTDEFRTTRTDSVVVLVTVKDPKDPVAIINPDGNQKVPPGSTITFDASQSNDPDGGPVTFAWAVSKKGVVSTKPTLTYKFEDQGVIGVELTVTDNEGKKTTKRIEVTVAPENPRDPVIVLKPDGNQELTIGDTFKWDASGSNDPDGGDVTFEWWLDSKLLSKEPTFSQKFAAQGKFTLQLVVRDNESKVARKTIYVTVQPVNPRDPVLIMNPDVDQFVALGATLTFDGSASNDPDGGELAFLWKTSVPGEVSKEPKFTRKFDKVGRMGIELTITDNEGNSVIKHINVWVSEPKDPLAIMDPSVDQFVNVDATLTFDGSRSKDPDGGEVTYAWKTTGRDGVVSTDSKYTRSFPKQGRAGIELIVTDDEGKQSKKHIDVWVSVANPQDPIADFVPGTPQTIKAGSSLTFDGSKSYDPDGGALRYEWKTTGKGVVSTSVKSTIKFPVKGKFGVELVVRDDEGVQAKKHIYVTVT